MSDDDDFKLLDDAERFARTQPRRLKLRGILPLCIVIGWLIFMAIHTWKEFHR